MVFCKNKVKDQNCKLVAFLVNSTQLSDLLQQYQQNRSIEVRKKLWLLNSNILKTARPARRRKFKYDENAF